MFTSTVFAAFGIGRMTFPSRGETKVSTAEQKQQIIASSGLSLFSYMTYFLYTLDIIKNSNEPFKISNLCLF